MAEDDGAIERDDFISAEALQAPLTLTKNIDILLKKDDELMASIRHTVAVIKDQKASLTDVNKATAALSKSEAELIEIQKKVIKSIQDEGAAMGQTDSALKKLQQDFAKLRTENERNTKEGQKLLKTIQEQAKELNNLKKQAKEAAEANKKLGDQFGALDNLTKGWLGNLKKLGEELLIVAKNPFFIAFAAVAGLFVAAKSAADAYYEATLQGEEDLAIAQAKDKAFVNVFEKKWEEAGERITTGWERMKEAWRELGKAFEDPSTADAQTKAESDLVKIEKERARLSKETMKDRIDDANTELKVLELLETAKDKEGFLAKERLTAQIKGGKLLAEQEEGDLILAKDKLELQRSIIEQQDHARGGQFDRTKSILKLTNEEISQIKVQSAEIQKLVELEEAYIKVQVNAQAKSVTRLKLELSLRKEVADEEQKEIAFQKLLLELMFKRSEQAVTLYDKLKTFSQDQTTVEVSGARERMAAAKAELDAKVAFLAKYQEERGKAERLENIEEFLSGALEIYNEFYGALSNLSSTLSANALQNIATEQEALKEAKDSELRIAGDNADAKAAIELKYLEKEKASKKEKAKLAHKQALVDKGLALFQAFLQEAQLILKALQFPPNPFAIAAAIAGGIQVAAIAAKNPPPAYAKGTNSAKGGPAIVGEVGSELVEEPSGKKYFTPATATLLNIPRGSKISTHEETLSRIATNNIGVSERPPTQNELVAIRGELRRQTTVLENKPFLKVGITERGVSLEIQRVARRERRLGSLYI